ncbi:MAG: DUF839 domain-containing protein [Alphaproteobacteria bacterium]|nr:DUF839 domain-containing protein [Alphaproteobacteria bacterium]
MRDDDSYCERPFPGPTFAEVVARRISRRAVLRGGLAASAAFATVSPAALLAGCGEKDAAPADHGTGVAFAELAHGVDETVHVAEGYDVDVLIRWGDPVLPGAPAFDPAAQTEGAQAMQFGYNNDFIGFVALGGQADHGLLCVNHEYVSPEIMFPAIPEGLDEVARTAALKQQAAVEMAAMGGSVLEVRRKDGKWSVVPDSRYARRITVTTPMALSGPAAGHALMKTAADPDGKTVLGTLNDCAGGMTPWGTYLMAEENFHKYFGGNLPENDPRRASYFRYSIPGGGSWSVLDPRFDAAHEPNEPFRFGWVVEVNPFDPASTPVKRTALGRFCHEGAESIVNKDGRVVVYMGDDSRFEYLYRFVSDGKVDADSREANAGLLDKGTLSVARFNDDGTLAWLPLVHGRHGLDAAHGFDSQAQVLIDARRAGDVLGATPLDRPEDVEPNPKTGKVYMMLTNNPQRGAPGYPPPSGPDPRADNTAGQIIEIAPDGNDHAADTARWELLVLCGDPTREAVGASWNPATSANGWFSSPDNCAIDPSGNLWVATDQGGAWAYNSGLPDPETQAGTLPAGATADGLWYLKTEGEGRGTGRMFFRCPVGAELTGPRFAPDGEALFLSVQHPGDSDSSKWPAFDRPSTFADPATRWPDFKPDMPPRPSVVVITKKGGGRIGSA